MGAVIQFPQVSDRLKDQIREMQESATKSKVNRMKERRVSRRNMCAELLVMSWIDRKGRHRQEVVILDDISTTGARVRLEHAVPVETSVALSHPKGQYPGKVKYCIFEAAQYSLGIAFDEGHRWSKSDFKPSHLLEIPESTTT